MPIITQGKNISSSAQINPGVVENTDIADDAVSKAKMADDAVASSEIEDGAIVNADINSSAGIVDTKLATIATAGKVSGAALTLLANIPAGAGIIPPANLPALNGFERLGETILGAAASSISVASFAARKFLYFEWHRIDTAQAAGSYRLRFNSDTGANYARVGNVSQTSIIIGSTDTGDSYYVFHVTNRSANRKGGFMEGLFIFAAGTAPSRTNETFSWDNVLAQITTIAIDDDGANASIGAGSRLTVFGSID